MCSLHTLQEIKYVLIQLSVLHTFRHDCHAKEFINRWTQAGDEAYTDVPVIADQRMKQNDNYIGYLIMHITIQMAPRS